MPLLDRFSELVSHFESTDWTKCWERISPSLDGYIYVLSAQTDNVRFPVYVGQTGRLAGRMGDYEYCAVWAPTDYKVGSALKYLQETGNLRVHFKKTPQRIIDEALLIRQLQLFGFHLVNDLSGYRYVKGFDVEPEQTVIYGFCDMLLRENVIDSSMALERQRRGSC